MHDDDAVCLDNLFAVPRHNRIKLRVLPEFRSGQQRREFFLTKIVKNDLMAVPAQRLRRRAGNGVVEAPVIRMGKDDGNFHQLTAINHPPALPRFFPGSHNRPPGRRWREQSNYCRRRNLICGDLRCASV